MAKPLLYTMKKITALLLILIVNSCSIGKVAKKEVLTYHELPKEQKLIYGKVVKERYEVKKGTKVKHGIYERYSLNALLLEKGTYENGEKTRIWAIWNNEDEIWIEKNFNQDGKENAIIHQEYLSFPMDIVEKRDTLPIGQVVLKVTFIKDCELEKAEILRGVDREFDTRIVNEYKRYVWLCNKYHKPIEECIQNRDTLRINFTK